MNFVQAQEQVLCRLRALVRDEQFTQTTLSRRLGLSQAHVNNLLHGVRPITAEVADRALEAFGWTLDELLATAPPGLTGLIPQHLLQRVVKPAIVRVTSAHAALDPIIQQGDLILVETAAARRRALRWPRLYVLRVNSEMLVRRCEVIGRDLLAVGSGVCEPKMYSLRRFDVENLIFGEVLWVGRAV